VFGGLFDRVQVVALLTAAGFAVALEQFAQLVEQVGFGAEVGEVFALGQGGGHGLLHGATLIAVVAVALDHGRGDAFALEDLLEGPFHRAGPCA
jgi:hypothetical protein